MEVNVGDLAAQTDQFGLFNLFLIASPMVKLVMIGLVFACPPDWATINDSMYQYGFSLNQSKSMKLIASKVQELLCEFK